MRRQHLASSGVCGAGGSEWWFEGNELETTESPRLAVLGDYLPVTENPEVAAAGVDRPSGPSEIRWYPAGHAPPDLRVCPPQLFGKPGKVQMVHDWSNPSDGPSGALSNPGAGRGAMGGPPSRLRPGAYMAVLAPQNCFLH